MPTMDEHLKNASSQYDDWRKNLTVLAIGALTVLVAMMPKALLYIRAITS